MVDIGVYWSPAVLEHKLERRDARGDPEEIWNCVRLPKGLDVDPDGNYLFVASARRWAGFFKLSPEVTYAPEDPRCPFGLLLRVKTWTTIDLEVPRSPFRGWTYDVPAEILASKNRRWPRSGE